jgi:hypothetical protein
MSSYTRDELEKMYEIVIDLSIEKGKNVYDLTGSFVPIWALKQLIPSLSDTQLVHFIVKNTTRSGGHDKVKFEDVLIELESKKPYIKKMATLAIRSPNKRLKNKIK